MSSNKGEEFKEHLSAGIKKNKRAPVWVYLKTKDRDKIRNRDSRA